MDIDALRWAGTTFASLFPLVNPINAVPLFAVMTTDLSDSQRNRQATRAGFFAGVILAVTAFAGAVILDFFGINLGMLQVAGGLIVGQAAWAMVTGNPQVSPTEARTWSREKRAQAQQTQAPAPAEAAPRNDIAFSPVAMPVLAGPAAMGVVVGLTSQSSTITADIGIFLGIAGITLLAIVGLRASNAILRLLGASGILALQRVFGFILLAIAVALVANGVSALFGLGILTE